MKAPVVRPKKLLVPLVLILLFQLLPARLRPSEETTTGKADSLFDPNILIAQVQAAKADDFDDLDNLGPTSSKLNRQRGPSSQNPIIDNSEESNIIPFADVPEDENVPHEQNFDDRDITVINLQKDKAKQNFKGFVDTDLIDDSLRNRNPPPAPKQPAAFFPTLPLS